MLKIMLNIAAMDIYQRKKLTRDFCRHAIGLMAALPAFLPHIACYAPKQVLDEDTQNTLKEMKAEKIDDPDFLKYVSEKYSAFGAGFRSVYGAPYAVGLMAGNLSSSQGGVLLLSGDMLDPRYVSVPEFNYVVGHEATHERYDDAKHRQLGHVNSLLYSAFAAKTALLNLFLTFTLSSSSLIGIMIPVCLTASAILARGLEIGQARQDEYIADLNAVAVNGHPQAAISMLSKMRDQKERMCAPGSESFLRRAYHASKIFFGEHPSDSRRIEAIRDYAASKGMVL